LAKAAPYLETASSSMDYRLRLVVSVGSALSRLLSIFLSNPLNVFAVLTWLAKGLKSRFALNY